MQLESCKEGENEKEENKKRRFKWIKGSQREKENIEKFEVIEHCVEHSHAIFKL